MHQPLTADGRASYSCSKNKNPTPAARMPPPWWLIGNFEPVPAEKSDKNRWTVNRRNAPRQNHTTEAL
jgi:hypothetical protein